MKSGTTPFRNFSHKQLGQRKALFLSLIRVAYGSSFWVVQLDMKSGEGPLRNLSHKENGQIKSALSFF
ncbi:hypothetical protein SAMN04490247_2779 [Salimicrobium halophilum]|uniref:Uncharacterized protein n=1 Tax=Salimicrobium halophilum TaxID=86666 RepID=A0A1G8VLB5_9BACI|nr:hypothetical protein SAMN04490247_2779 [Salimicrobium halophilum]